MSLPTISGEFRLGGDPDLRFTPNGKAICNLRVVASKRKKDGDTWVDDKQVWLDVVCWEQLAENVAESLKKGDLITVHGVVYGEEWEDKDGNKRTSYKIQPYSIGPALSYATAKVSKAERGGGQQGGQQQDPWAGAQSAQNPSQDPWYTGPQTDEPPF